MLKCDQPEKPKKVYYLPKVSKKRAAAIADGSFKPKPRKPINKKAEKRKNEEALYYGTTRPVYLKENPVCECCKKAKADQIHHKRGRIGKLLNDVRYFLACCDGCHKIIEANPEWAKLAKYSLSRLAKYF